MTKSLQILLGLILILVLAYVAFLDVSTKIKDDLLTKTKVMFSENNVRGVTANIQGEGLIMSRSLLLTGTAISDVERVRIVSLIENVEGVCNIDNQIELYPVVPKAPAVPLVPKVPTAIEVSPVKTVTESNIVKSTLKELTITKDIETKSIVKTEVEQKEVAEPLSSPTINTKIPTVPTVESKSIVVPTPVKVIAVPKVIEVEKIKLEGVK